MNRARASERIRVLDAFRGIAVLAVLACHYFATWQRPDNLYRYDQDHSGFASLGGLGVEFFFMISGFVILLTLEQCDHLLEFWLRRFARLYPALVVCALLTWGITAILGPPQFQRGPIDVAASLLLLGSQFAHATWVDGVYWSLQVEIVFYFWIGFLYLVGAPRFAAVWSVFCLLALALWVVGSLAADTRLVNIAQAVLLVRFLPFFGLGMFFYGLYMRRRASPIIAVISLITYVPVWWGYSASVHASFVIMVLAFFLFTRGQMAWLTVAPLLLVGDISYSLYLIHNNIGVAVIRFLKTATPAHDFVAAGSAASLCLVAAWAMQRFVERPARQWITRIAASVLSIARDRLGLLSFG